MNEGMNTARSAGKRAGALIPVFVLLALALVSPARAGGKPPAETKIQEIGINLRLAGKLPGPMRDRISESVLKVGEKALLGKTLEEAAALKPSLTQVMKKIFNEVLGGFDVLELSIHLENKATIDIYLECKAPVVEKVDVEIAPQQGIHAVWNPLFREILSGTAAELEAELAGTPVESEPWSRPLLEALAEEKIQRAGGFGGFQLVPRVEMGSRLILHVDVKPAAPTIRMAAVKVRSTTMPSLALERIKFDMARYTDFLLGVPLEFAAEHEDFIIKEYRRILAGNVFAGKLDLDFQIKIMFQPHTVVKVVAESRKYKGFARAKGSLGKEDRNPDVEGHLGIYPLKDIEMFAEFNFLPGPVNLQFDLGIGRRFGNFEIGAGRNVTDGIDRIWMNCNLTEDIIASWEKGVVENKNEEIEASITLRAHDFFSIELVSDLEKDFWLRFVANL